MNKWVCEYCYATSDDSILPPDWDMIWQSVVCPECVRRLAAKTIEVHTTPGGAFANTVDPRFLDKCTPYTNFNLLRVYTMYVPDWLRISRPDLTVGSLVFLDSIDKTPQIMLLVQIDVVSSKIEEAAQAVIRHEFKQAYNMGLTLGRESIRYATTTLPFRWLMITGSEL
jgi:hypothetical protein